MKSSPNTGQTSQRGGSRVRLTLLALLGAVFLIVALPLTGYLLVGDSVAQQAQQQGSVNPLSEYWRSARQGNEGTSAVDAPAANVLITDSGQNFRQLRNGPLATYGAWIMAGVLLILAALFLIRGRVQIEGGRAALTVERWTLIDRVLHWYVAILFIILGITGLSLLYGRAVLIPVLGGEVFAAYAQLAIYTHNYLGPFFAAGLLLMLLKWVSVNVPKGHDLKWFLAGGGFLKGAHPHAGFVNAGEKLLFWFLATVGVVMVISGLVLVFPVFGLSREAMQLSLLVHATSSILVISFIFGHMYLAIVAMKGSLEGMVGGRVDVNWARQHHDLWAKELEEKGVKPQPAANAAPAPKPAEDPRPAAS